MIGLSGPFAGVVPAGRHDVRNQLAAPADLDGLPGRDLVEIAARTLSQLVELDSPPR